MDPEGTEVEEAEDNEQCLCSTHLLYAHVRSYSSMHLTIPFLLETYLLFCFPSDTVPFHHNCKPELENEAMFFSDPSFNHDRPRNTQLMRTIIYSQACVLRILSPAYAQTLMQ